MCVCVFQVSGWKKLGMVGRNNILFCQNSLLSRWCQNLEAVRKTTKILTLWHAYQSLACETAINTDFSELFSLKRI